MPEKDHQKFIISLISKVLKTQADETRKFNWLTNKPDKSDFQDRYELIMKIFDSLKGNPEGLIDKAKKALTPDAYFGEDWNFILEFDEIQHFTLPRKKTLLNYPSDIKLGFDKNQYIRWCELYSSEAISKGAAGYRKPTVEFNFVNGRHSQRAFFDCFRDILADIHNLNPTIRISEFEVNGINLGHDKDLEQIKKILIKKFELANKPELIRKLESD